MEYDIIIGLEIHTEIKTKSKMFCSCPNHSGGDESNTNVCPICLGHPGTLPTANLDALKKGLLLGLALNCKFNSVSKFDRKNYFYPDLPKGYQISQYDLPIAYGGYLTVEAGRDIGIIRIHLEEDTGKLTHDKAGHSLVDFNRAGAPLLEMVSEPTIASAAEAKKFCQRFQQILRYLDVSDANMEKGQMRCEANVSLQEKGRWEYADKLIKPIGDYELNNKVEVKNINSFRSLEKAINFEVERQAELLKKGEKIKAETRGWNDNTNQTVSQRVKETAADYRYFPEPDIPPFFITEAMIAKIAATVNELPQAKTERFRTEYGLSEMDAEFLTSDKDLAGYAEKVFSEVKGIIEANGESWQKSEAELNKLTTNWLTSELLKHLNLNRGKIADLKIAPIDFAKLITLLFEEKINSSAGQIILNQMYQIGGDPEEIMETLNLKQLDNSDELEELAKQVFADNPKQAEEFLNGKTALLQFFIGKIMAASKGKANPKNIPEIIEKISKNLNK
jgi:aspartyl-tRNA(Asn)/glutamyl-tRNA(Gln) amidotransferase subunit B